MLPTELRTEVLRIDYPKNKSTFCKRFGLNAYWAGKHWSARRKDAQEWHMLVMAALQQANTPRKPLENPVVIEFYHNDRMDIDNHAAIEKMIVDGLKGWVLHDDTKRYYCEKVSRFHQEDFILVVIKEVSRDAG